jgi:hypothetical protein
MFLLSKWSRPVRGSSSPIQWVKRVISWGGTGYTHTHTHTHSMSVNLTIYPQKFPPLFIMVGTGSFHLDVRTIRGKIEDDTQTTERCELVHRRKICLFERKYAMIIKFECQEPNRWTRTSNICTHFCINFHRKITYA